MFEIYDFDKSVNSFFYDDQMFPSIAALSDGNYVIAWKSYNQQYSDFDICAKIYDKNKYVIKHEFLVNTIFNAEHQDRPKALGLNNGKFVIIYRTADCPSSWNRFHATMFNNDGTFLIQDTALTNCDTTI